MHICSTFYEMISIILNRGDKQFGSFFVGFFFFVFFFFKCENKLLCISEEQLDKEKKFFHLTKKRHWCLSTALTRYEKKKPSYIDSLNTTDVGEAPMEASHISLKTKTQKQKTPHLTQKITLRH